MKIKKLINEIARMISEEVEMGLLESPDCSFDYPENYTEDMKESQDFYLRLAERVIEKVKK